jgi:hypothetical protein
MSVNESVFGSKSERRKFEKLSRRWGDEYQIYHNLPFLNVFSPSDLVSWWESNPKEFSLDEIEMSRLKKTSIDFTLCDDADKPILCIEFDGLKSGYNVGAKYYSRRQPGEWRQTIMDLKLKVAHGSEFPFFVISSEEFSDIEEDVESSIVDGVIGEVLAKKETSSRLQREFDPSHYGYSEPEFQALSSFEKNQIIQDWAIGIEVEATLKHNPISRLSAELCRTTKYESYSFRYLNKPKIDPKITDPLERAKLLQDTKFKGCRLSVSTTDLGDISSTVWIPNFQTPNFSGLGLVEDMSKITALKKVRRIRGDDAV